MTINTQSKASSTANGVRPPELASVILDSLDAAVLVVDRNGAICDRNTTAASWLPDGPDLPSAFTEARFLEPFESWSTELPRVIDEGQGSRFEAALRLPLFRKDDDYVAFERVLPESLEPGHAPSLLSVHAGEGTNLYRSMQRVTSASG